MATADESSAPPNLCSEAGPQDLTFVENERQRPPSQGLPGRGSCRPGPPGRPHGGIPSAHRNERSPCGSTSDSLAAFIVLMRRLHGRQQAAAARHRPRAVRPSLAQIGAEPAFIPLPSIGEGSVIGARCRIHSGAVIGRNCRLGDDVILLSPRRPVRWHGPRRPRHHPRQRRHRGRRLRLPPPERPARQMPQLGCVEIGDDVEIGACTTIDRGTFQATRDRRGHQDRQPGQIGHNCQIGRHNLLRQPGRHRRLVQHRRLRVMAGQVGVADHSTSATAARSAPSPACTEDVPAGERMLGAPAGRSATRNASLSASTVCLLLQRRGRMKRQLGCEGRGLSEGGEE